MKCPHCGTALTAYATACPACHTAFAPDTANRLALYFALADEEAAFDAFKRDLARISDELSRRRGALRQALETELALGPAEPIRTGADLASPAPTAPTPHAPDTPTAAAKSATPPTDDAERLFPPRPATTDTPPPRPRPIPAAPPSADIPRTVLSEVRIGQRWLLLLGVVAVLAGLGYFFKYSMEHGWVPPVLRVLACYGGGIAFMLAGEGLRRKSYEKYGLYLTGLGVALFSFATYAGYGLYHLFGQVPAYALMVLTTVLAMALAIRHNSQGMAVLGLLVGYTVPFLLGGPGDEALRLPYIVLLSLGLTIVCTRQAWIPLRALTVALAYAAFGQWYTDAPARQGIALPFGLVNALAAIFLLVPFAFEYRRDDNPAVDVVSWLISPLCALALSYFLVSGLWRPAAVALVPLAYCAVFAGLASLLARRGRQATNRFVVLVACAAVTLALVPPILWSFHWLTMAWALLSLAVTWIGLRLANVHFFQAGVTGLSIVLAKFLLWDYPKALHRAALAGYAHSGERLLSEALLLGTLPILAVMLCRWGSRVLDENAVKTALRATTLAMCLLVWLTLTNECRLFFREYFPAAGHAATSVLWTVYGAVLLLAGFRANRRPLRLAALCLLGLTWLKVFLVDTADFATPYRILVLLLLGLSCIGLSFLYHKFKSRVLDDDASTNR